MATSKSSKKKASGGSKKKGPRVYPNVPKAGLSKGTRYCGGGKMKK